METLISTVYTMYHVVSLFSQWQNHSLIAELKDEDSKEKCMLDLLHSLPDANYYTIAFMIEHLVR